MSEIAVDSSAVQGNGNAQVYPPKAERKNGEDKKSKNKKKKKKKKRERRTFSDSNNAQENNGDNGSAQDVEIEYVAANPLEELDMNDPAYQEFAKIFEQFAKNAEESVAVPEVPDKKKEEEKAKEEKAKQEAAKKKKGSDDEGDDEEDEYDENGNKKISKKEKKKQRRISIAVLKQLVQRPDAVEAWDVTSADPKLLVFLKSYRNTVPVPRHWNQKRKYLQGKRGIEKPPFSLPEFIAATGISKIRQALEEKDAAKKLKSKAREKMQAKVGKMDIDYQILHDAFFKYQTKPKLTIHGDMYYEGKEFEITLKEKRPGTLSDDLKRALGMPEGAPPPWLLNMQRYGPPPSYPNLKIPGLNCPIPEGARYGYHPGGWGKPPVDEFGRPIYGDVFGLVRDEPSEIMQPIDKKHWGEIEEEELAEEEEEEEQEEEEESEQASGIETPSGLITPSGMDTPETLELRKAPPRAAAREEEDDSGKQLYQVIQQTDSTVGGALYGSSHTYVIPSTEKRPKNAVDLMRSQATEKLDIALNPSEVENLEDLSEETLRKKYEQARAEKNAATAKEDVSDILMENLQKKRKKKDDKSDSKSKKYKDFKF